ncbi:MAG: NUMOD4 domain-containing protein [Cyclobacteriaceae bacterium]
MAQEIWKEYADEKYRSTFLVSNYGRVKSRPRNKPGEEILLSGYKNAGYNAIPTRKIDGKNTLIYVHKIVANLFVENPKEEKWIIFKDGDRGNCKARNLEWVDKVKYNEYRKQFQKSAYDYYENFRPNPKLTTAKVKVLKKILGDPNRKTRMKIISKQFGVSLSALYSIKRGDSWKDV